MSSSLAPAVARPTRYWLRAWWPVALGIAIIAFESTEMMGADNTSSMLRPVWQFFFGNVSNAAWESIHHIIRKSGHFIGYGLLGLAWLHSWRRTLLSARSLAHASLALAGTAVIASADEIHQAFLPNRTSSPWDVLLDCSGGLALLLLALAIQRMRRPRQLARAA